MKGKLPYKDLTQVMRYLKLQILDSIPFACEVCPEFPSNDPRALFDWLKTWTQYKNDPQGIEYLQCMQTLWDNEGRGDCDCFTITTVACLAACGYKNIEVILVGREKKRAVHIYVQTIVDGTRYTLDLTNRDFNKEREYPFKQKLKFKI